MPKTSTRDRTGIVGFGIELIFFILYYVVKSMPLWLEIIGFVVGGLLILYGISGHLMRFWRFISNKQAPSASTSSETSAKPPPPDSVGSLPIEKVPSETLGVLQVIRDREKELLANFLPDAVDWWTTSICGSIYRFTRGLDIESSRERNPMFEKKKANDFKLKLPNERLGFLKSRLKSAKLEKAITGEFEHRNRTQAFEIYVAVKAETADSHDQSALENELVNMRKTLRDKQVYIAKVISEIAAESPQNRAANSDATRIIQELEAIKVSLNGVEVTMARLFWGLRDLLADGLGETHIRWPLESRFQEKEPAVWAKVQKELITTLTIKKLIRSEQRKTTVHGTETHFILTDLGCDVLRELETRRWPAQ